MNVCSGGGGGCESASHTLGGFISQIRATAKQRGSANVFTSSSSSVHGDLAPFRLVTIPRKRPQQMILDMPRSGTRQVEVLGRLSAVRALGASRRVPLRLWRKQPATLERSELPHALPRARVPLTLSPTQDCVSRTFTQGAVARAPGLAGNGERSHAGSRRESRSAQLGEAIHWRTERSSGGACSPTVVNSQPHETRKTETDGQAPGQGLLSKSWPFQRCV